MKAKFINEVLNFERGKDPKESMNIGKLHRYKKLYMDLYKSMPGFFSPKILDLNITNEIFMIGFYSFQENYKKIRNFFIDNSDFEFIKIKDNILYIKERETPIKESFNRNDNSFNKLKIGRKNIDLKFEDLKKGENYLATILGADENEEDLKNEVKILDKNEISILVCNLQNLAEVKRLAKQSKTTLNLNFLFKFNVGIEDAALDELIYEYDHIDDHIETVMGYRVKFNYLE
ncbi:MAG: hypothetical protein PHF86_00645 [Candidatus Nanoarchaeia archaeon]|nr:hypothetical protein [Candidatus Nanoarchaeia archaeon]